MNKIAIALFWFFLAAFRLEGQDHTARKYARTITTGDLYRHVAVLSADSLEGRETGRPGQKKAARYISAHFEQTGLMPPVVTAQGRSYYQEYELKKLTYRTAYLKKGDEVKENFRDFLYYSKAETMGEEYIEVIFITKKRLETLRSRDLKGKYLAILDDKSITWHDLLQRQEVLEAEGLFFFEPDKAKLEILMARFSHELAKDREKLEWQHQDDPRVIVADPVLGEWIFDKPLHDLKNHTTARLILNADMLPEAVPAENVLGYLEGSIYPEEVLVLTAHYDHEGVIDGMIYNGADDNASGTAAIMEIAEAFALAAEHGARPKRSILFMAVSGEEKGLLGSKYYCQNPVRPLENTVANLNVDMIGRVDAAHTDNPDYIYLIGSDRLSRDLHDLSERTNATYTQLELDYTYNALGDPNRYYYRSDHYNFAKNNVPVIFYFNGIHEDYHRPTDTIEKLDFGKIRKITRLIFFTAWEIANRDERIQLNHNP